MTELDNLHKLYNVHDELTDVKRCLATYSESNNEKYMSKDMKSIETVRK